LNVVQCSLHENQGLTLNRGSFAVKAIESIKIDHSIKALFFWAFSQEGEKLAEKLSGLIGLPLYKR
jgi:hypothetical protein